MITTVSVELGGVTSRLAVLLVTPSLEAVMPVAPTETPVARPEVSMVATPVFELAHVTLVVISLVLSSS